MKWDMLSYIALYMYLQLKSKTYRGNAVMSTAFLVKSLGSPHRGSILHQLLSKGTRFFTSSSAQLAVHQIWLFTINQWGWDCTSTHMSTTEVGQFLVLRTANALRRTLDTLGKASAQLRS